jgi:hypothetical protein
MQVQTATSSQYGANNSHKAASMSNSTRDKIINYLGQGIQQSIVATSCGVTPAYVSQLLEIPEVREEIARLKAGQLEAAIAADSSLERIEKSALKMVEQKLPFVRSAVEAAKIFATLNAAKRKATPDKHTDDAIAAQQVTITLPKASSLHFRINSSNQVIEVEGRAMAPLPSRALPELQKRLSAAGLEGVGNVFTDIVSTSLAPKESLLTAAALTHKEQQTAADQKRATSVLDDLTTFMNGVAVVL